METKMNKMEVMKISIFGSNREEINEIVELIQIRKEMLSKEKMNKLEVGDKVFFVKKNGIKVNGVITKKNIKRLVVDTDQGSWNVPASMLTLIEE
tara:strand:- start:44 stop:328 length:285 start_codon:yes stop_codon:yes gene_type:complete